MVSVLLLVCLILLVFLVWGIWQNVLLSDELKATRDLYHEQAEELRDVRSSLCHKQQIIDFETKKNARLFADYMRVTNQLDTANTKLQVAHSLAGCTVHNGEESNAETQDR